MGPPPPPGRASLKLNRKERGQKKDLRAPLGVAIGTSSTEGRALTNSTNPSSYIQHFV